MEIKILSILPIIGHPRDSKRIDMLKAAGFNLTAIAFSRENQNSRPPSCHVVHLGKLRNGHYVERAFTLLAAFPKVRESIKKVDLVYASGPDMALLARFSGIGLNKPVILEIGDIREVQVSNSSIGKIMRKIDKFIANGCELIVATASGFVYEYYQKWVGAHRDSMILENKLERSIISEDKSPRGSLKSSLENKRIRIGYFGALRCLRSWEILRSVAEAKPSEIEIIIAGYSLLPFDFSKAVSRYDNMKFVGSYKSPEDLDALYKSVDIVWACYPFPSPQDFNWRWARTNRFYESCYFKIPMIALEGSGDAETVSKYDIGTLIPNVETNLIVDKILEIEHNDLVRWKQNLVNLPEEVYVYTTEASILKRKIVEIITNKSGK